MNAHVPPIEYSTSVIDVPPDRLRITQAIETKDPEATVSAIAIQRFDAANPTARSAIELSARKAEAERRSDERARTQRNRDEYGRYAVRSVAPFSAAAGLMGVLSAVFAGAIYLIEMLALWYAQTVYVAQAAFFDKIADDLLQSLPYTAVVLFGAPMVFGIGLRQRNDRLQSRFAVRSGWFGVACLAVCFLMLGLMGSGLLSVRSPYTGWAAFAMIASHGPASMAMGAALGLILHLNRQDSGTQQVVRGEGYEHGDALLRTCEAEEFKVVTRIGELQTILSAIAAGRAACEAIWLTELADIQAELSFAALEGRAQRRSEILAAAQLPAVVHPIPGVDVSNSSFTMN